MRFYGRHGSIPVEWIDGFRNEERAPNVRYTGRPADLGPVGPGAPKQPSTPGKAQCPRTTGRTVAYRSGETRLPGEHISATGGASAETNRRSPARDRRSTREGI